MEHKKAKDRGFYYAPGLFVFIYSFAKDMFAFTERARMRTSPSPLGCGHAAVHCLPFLHLVRILSSGHMHASCVSSCRVDI